jgi:uncharacterized protein (TIGR00369 family)
MHLLHQHPLIKEYQRKNQFGKLIDADFEIRSPGNVVYGLTVKDEHLATPHHAHGGLIAALLDAVTGVGALSLVCTENKVVATVNLNVSYILGARLGDVLRAQSSLVKQGNRLLFMNATVTNQEGETIAQASATLTAYPMEKAGY